MLRIGRERRKRTNRENPRRVPGQIGKIPGKVPKGQKRTKKEGQVQIGKPPRLKHPRLAALEKRAAMDGSLEDYILARNFPSRSKSRIFLIFGPSGKELQKQCFLQCFCDLFWLMKRVFFQGAPNPQPNLRSPVFWKGENHP